MSGLAAAVLYAMFAFGWVLVVLSIFQIGPFDFAGLTQGTAAFRGQVYRPPTFRTPFLYRIVRHPMMTGLLIGLWVTPHMTAGHLLFAAGMTGYILIGVTLEERALHRAFGESYAKYTQSTPRFFPEPWKVRSTAHASESADRACCDG